MVEPTSELTEALKSASEAFICSNQRMWSTLIMFLSVKMIFY